MSTPESQSNHPEFTVEEYATLLKSAAKHLARIAGNALVNDATLISEPIRHIIETPIEDLVKEIETPTDDEVQGDESPFWPQNPYY